MISVWKFVVNKAIEEHGIGKNRANVIILLTPIIYSRLSHHYNVAVDFIHLTVNVALQEIFTRYSVSKKLSGCKE